MDFTEYQEKSRKTAMYPNLGDNLPYLGLGIAGEAGEVSDKIKKLIRDEKNASVTSLSDEKKQELLKEVGDVLWYVSQMATELDASLDDVAKANIEKLYSRMDREKLTGSGDDR